MVYRWNVDGTSLEFPTPYAVENRFLSWRGYALIALSLLVSLMLAFSGDGDAVRPVVTLKELPEPASALPHGLAAMLMVVAGVLNLWQASRQRTLQMVPGQPASLMPEVPHEATGASPGAPWLMQALTRGVATAAVPGSPYARLLRRLGNDLATAPGTLHAYMRVRLSHLLLLGALALLLALSLALAQPVALPLALVSGVVLMLGAWFSAELPGALTWPRLGLPAGAAALLGLGLTFEGLALLAARRHIIAPRPARLTPEEITVSFDADLGALFGEIDRELHRRWAEGIPSRRYCRQPPVVDAVADEGSFNASVLEESQPLTAPEAGQARAPVAPSVQTRWLWLLDAAGLAVSVIGGLLWVWAARAHMQDPASSWLPATVGLVFIVAGAMRCALGTCCGAASKWILRSPGSTSKAPSFARPALRPPRRTGPKAAWRWASRGW